jgi:polyisoprenoid-binding protein YceI
MPVTSWSLDASVGELLVHTGVTGRAARLGHELTLAMTTWQATVSSDGDTPVGVELTVEVASLEVVRGSGGVKALSGPEKAMARSNALAALDAKHHPTIDFRTDAIEAAKDGFRLDGVLTIHGTSARRTVEVSVTDLGDAWRVTCDAVVRQTDFGVTPYSLFMGSVKVADDVAVNFAASWAKDD